MTSPTPRKSSKNLKPKQDQVSFDLKPNTTLHITIETGSLKSGKIPVTIHMDQAEKINKPGLLSKSFGILTSFLQKYSLSTWLFIFAVCIYLAIRLIGLTQFPIYFFTDEAIQTQSIVSLMLNGYRDGNGVLFPPYFPNGEYTNLSLSVYLQWLPLLLFGKSAWITRATSVFITLIAAISVGLILRDVFKNKYWWAGTLFLSMTPAWYLHSRTAFETAECTAFYAGTLCAYLFYRFKSPRYLYLTLFLAALTFYSYSPAQLIIPLTAIALLISDWRYHWENRKTIYRGLILLGILMIPYIRYRLEYPMAAFSHLNTLHSYLVEDIPLWEKVRRYFSEYGTGLSLWYWYSPVGTDLSRHLMKGYGHIMRITLPFAIFGLIQMLFHLRDSANRSILISLLVAPASAALAGIGITRVLIFVIPVAILTTMGLEQFFKWIENPVKNTNPLEAETKPDSNRLALALFLLVLAIVMFASFRYSIDRIVWPVLTILLALKISGALDGLLQYVRKLLPGLKQWQGWAIPQTFTFLLVFCILTYGNIFMLYDSLKNGPLWYKDYGMAGMQYGGFQIFDIVKQYKLDHPETNIIFSPGWANGTDILALFFLDSHSPFEMGSIAGYLTFKLPLDDNTLFVMTPEEYKVAASNSKLTDLRVEKTIPYPDGTPGFYFVRLRYADNIDEIFAAEKALRDIPRESVIMIDGQPVKIRHSYLDAGPEEKDQQNAINQVFDNNPLSLAKTFEANPFFIEMTFPSPRLIHGFSIGVGAAAPQITLKFYSTMDDAQPIIYTFEGQGSVEQPVLSFDLPQPTEANILQIEMFVPFSPTPAKIHIWEITLR